MTHLLIVEDEIDMALGLKDNFEYDDYKVTLSHDGEDGLKKALNIQPDLIILDIMLPKLSGMDICKELRKRGEQIPIIMLTARGQELDRVLGLELGADDYITKPFSIRELLARVKAVLRRAQNSDKKNSFQKFGKLKVDFTHYEAQDENGIEVEMTYKEFEILKFFKDHKGKTISRDELLDKVWGYEIYPTSRTVDNHIVKLRKKIETDPMHPKYIITVYGIGYKYVE